MLVVALASVAPPQEAAAQPLAALLGRTAYEVRLWLKQPLPRVVALTDARDEALALTGAIRALGHGALLVDTRDLTPVTGMVHGKRLAFDDHAFFANGTAGARLAYEAIEAIVHVASRSELRRTQIEKIGNPTLRARTPTMKVVETTTHEVRQEEALFLFPRDGDPPWLIEEQTAQYLGLGTHMRTTRRENFLTTMALLRARAWRAKFDDRFAESPITARNLIEVQGSGDPIAKGTEAGVALLASLLALALGSADGPYRRAHDGP